MDGNALISAYVLDGRGGARAVGWPEVRSWKPDDGVLWVHLDIEEPESRRWIKEEGGLGELVADALTEEGSRPRSVPMRDGLLVILRGITHIPGPEPNQMVSIRMWLDGQRIVSARRWRLTAVNEIENALKAGHGPRTPAEFLAGIADRLADSVTDPVDELDDRIDAIEDRIEGAFGPELSNELADIRRQAIQMRRHMAPQRDALSHLLAERATWLPDSERALIRESRESVTRHIEDLDATRDRCSVSQDQVAARGTRELNRTMYLLTVVTAFFLPLTFITGLFGMNLGGIPGEENPFGFYIWSGALAAVAVAEFFLFRRLRLLR